MNILNSGDNLFIVSKEHKKVQYGEPKYVYFIDPDVYEKVSKFVSLFKDQLDCLMNEGPEPGTCWYWEEDYHEKIVSFLRQFMPDVTATEISNSLCACGF